jgi:ElaB/YqjD/DUF883 family membrane-anchored ribosome-binding protein
LPDQETYDLRGASPVPPGSQTVPPATHPDGGNVPPAGGTTGSVESVAGQAQDKAQELAGQAQEKAQEVAGHGRAQLRDQIEQRSSQAAEQITRQADDLRTVSQTLREQGKVGPADAAQRLARYAERVGGYLRDRSPDQLLHDAEDLGRKRPWTAVGAGAALGFAASRFLKASSRERYARTPASQPSAASSIYEEEPRVGSPRVVAGAAPAGVPPLASPGAPVSGQTPGV